MGLAEPPGETNLAGSDMPNSEERDDAQSLEGLGYLFMLQPAPNQFMLEASTARRYSLHPEFMESPEGNLGVASASPNTLPALSSIVAQSGTFVRSSTERNGLDLQRAGEQELSTMNVLDVTTDLRSVVAYADVEELIPAQDATNHALMVKADDAPSSPSQIDAGAPITPRPDDVRAELQARPQLAEAPSEFEASAHPSPGLQAFQVRFSKPLEESAARERIRDTLRSAGSPTASAESTPTHTQSATTNGGSDESGAFIDAASAITPAEPDVQQMTPLRQVSVALESAEGPIHLRVYDRAGETRAWVSTATEQIARTLQKGLGELTQSLNAAGFEAEVSWPRTAGAALAQDVHSDTPQRDRNSQGTPDRESQDRGPDERGSRRERQSGEGDDFSSFLR